MEIAFTKVALPFGWLGNMSPHTVALPFSVQRPAWCEMALQYQKPEEIKPMIFRTAEAAFQGLRFDDGDTLSSIWREKSPMGAKMAAKKNAAKMVVVPRSKEDVRNMLKVLSLKLEQHPELREQLLETGDAKIIEDCSNRRNDSGLFWGAANVDGLWVGHNKLGRTWMQLREYCRHDIPMEMVRNFAVPQDFVANSLFSI
jgi:predicted NAD-dependent protein-ADP-ribosyltransferase YbiA (DUF1768 family)